MREVYARRLGVALERAGLVISGVRRLALLTHHTRRVLASLVLKRNRTDKMNKLLIALALAPAAALVAPSVPRA